MDTEILIIGSGMVGMSLAYQLKKRFKNKKITIIEKEKEIGQDESKKFQNDIDNMTSEYIKIIDGAHKQKEEDLKKI